MLSNRLKDVLQTSSDNIAICIPKPLSSYYNLNQESKELWKKYLN